MSQTVEYFATVPGLLRWHSAAPHGLRKGLDLRIGGARASEARALSAPLTAAGVRTAMAGASWVLSRWCFRAPGFPQAYNRSFKPTPLRGAA